MIIIESEPNLTFSLQRTKLREGIEISIVRKAEILMHGMSNNTNSEIELRGRTIDQLAKELADSPGVVGIRTFRRVEGTVMVSGRPVQVSSQNFDVSSTTYINGEILTINDIRRYVSHPEKERILSYMESTGWSGIVRTRTGQFKRFEEGDRNISLSIKEPGKKR